MTIESRLAKARADVRELEWVTRRIAAAREDRERIAAQLAITEQARGFEQADVERLTSGIGGVFRRLVSNHTDLTKEQQELAAIQLLCDELADELRAIDYDLEQLADRRLAVRDAAARYGLVLDELETTARAQGQLHAELDTLAETEAELTRSRVEASEAMAVGITVQRILGSIVDLVRKLQPPRDRFDTGEGDKLLGEDLLAALSGKTSTIYSDLCRSIANANQGLRQFDHTCREISVATAAQGALAHGLSPLTNIGGLVFREVLWSNAGILDQVLDEVARISSALVNSVGELRERDAKIATASAECARVRARLLDPAERS